MEKIKELGFTICAIALAGSNLFTFIMIIWYGINQIVEPWKWLLYIETALDIGFIAWGFERLIKDIIRIRRQ